MESLKLFWLIMKRTSTDRLLFGFFIFYLADSVVLWMTDPALENLGDALWLGFNIATSIGLGDYTVTTPLARIAAALLGLYGVVIVAFIPGMIASYYMEKTRISANETIEQNYEDLEKIGEMNTEQLKSLSAKIRKGRTQNEKS